MDPSIATVLAAVIGFAGTALGSYLQWKNTLDQEKDPALRYRNQARLARTTTVGIAFTLVAVSVGVVWWVATIVKRIPMPALAAALTKPANVPERADTDGFVVAWVRYSGKGAVKNDPQGRQYGQTLMVAHMGSETRHVDDQLHTVAKCEANASSSNGTEACSLMFPVPKGYFYKIKTTEPGFDGVVEVKFYPLVLTAR